MYYVPTYFSLLRLPASLLHRARNVNASDHRSASARRIRHLALEARPLVREAEDTRLEVKIHAI